MSQRPIVSRLLEMPPACQDREVFRSTAGTLTFEELRQSMLRIAGWLTLEMGVRPGERVALCLPKSIEAVQLIYGILACGAAYVPLPVPGPMGRFRAMSASIRPSLLLAAPNLAALIEADRGEDHPPGFRQISIESGKAGLASLLNGAPIARTCTSVGPDDLAAILFTSGSTGEPKGVMFSQRYLEATTQWVTGPAGMNEADRLVSNSVLHYAGSLDLFFPLTSGASVFVLSDREAMFPGIVADLSARERVTIWTLSTAALRLLLEQGSFEAHDLGALRRVEFFGEAMPLGVLQRLLAALPQAQFVSGFGATEFYPIFQGLPGIEWVIPRHYSGGSA